MSPKLRFFSLAASLSLAADQLSKQWVRARIPYGESREVVPGVFDLTYVHNPGGAFSFLADGDPAQRFLLFVGVTVVAIGMLLAFVHRLEPGSRLAAGALGMVLGGALGNLIDRLLYGGVIDFLDVYLWGDFSWPTFNLADSCIVVGVLLLLVEGLQARHAPASPERAPPGPEWDASESGGGGAGGR